MNTLRLLTPMLLMLTGALAGSDEGGPHSGHSPESAKAAPGGLVGIQSRPLSQSARDSDASAATLFEEISSDHSNISWNLEWRNPELHIKQFLLLNPVGGICTGDFDGDGKPDIYATSPSNSGRLFRNLGGFQFEDVTRQAGLLDKSLWGTAATFVDIDNDGDLDLYVCGYACPNRLYVNHGDLHRNECRGPASGLCRLPPRRKMLAGTSVLKNGSSSVIT